MPLLVRAGDVEVLIRTRDEHPPPHVHVSKKDAWEIRVRIDNQEVAYWGKVANKCKPRRPRLAAVDAALHLVAKHHDRACALWEAAHGSGG